MNIKFNSQHYLYHGTIDLYGDLIEQKGIRIIQRTDNGVDFGAGFYLSSHDTKLAVRTAIRRTEKTPPPSDEMLELLGMSRMEFLIKRNNEGFKPVVLKFQINDYEAWNVKKHLQFCIDDEEWQKHVWKWRRINGAPQMDTTFGPVADNGLRGASHLDILAIQNANQIAIHNQETADLLNLLEVKPC
ncbi:DUF3990 domain-containing protein [Bacillus cereus]|uniref:DUF3990 domain-containing protein n=1 Tax=Bacillus cereus TaxID=1396 RepID=UPI003CEAFE4F